MKDSALKVYIDSDLHKELKAHCAQFGRIMSHFVEQAIKDQLAFERKINLKQSKKEKRT